MFRLSLFLAIHSGMCSTLSYNWCDSFFSHVKQFRVTSRGKRKKICTWVRQIIYKKGEKSGPREGPCGTPQPISNAFETLPLIETH